MPLYDAKLALNAHNLVACINNSLESGLRFVSKGVAEQDPWSGCAAFEDTAGRAHL